MTSSETINIRYSCHTCGIKDIEVIVPTRNENEDVVAWVENIMGNVLREDHNKRSPQCPATSAQDVKIPTLGRDYIGGPIQN